MSYLYILKLQGDNYYVGTTDNIDKRLNQHFSGRGSAWTKFHQPETVIEVRNINSITDEDSTTKELMLSVGIEKVRGGSYCQVKLDPETKSYLERELCTITKTCFKCGKGNHFASRCNSKQPKKKPHYTECNRCGRKNHTIGNCYAKTDINGYLLPESCKRFKNGCNRCGRKSHNIDRCFANTDIDGYILSDSDSDSDQYVYY